MKKSKYLYIFQIIDISKHLQINNLKICAIIISSTFRASRPSHSDLSIVSFVPCLTCVNTTSVLLKKSTTEGIPPSRIYPYSVKLAVTNIPLHQQQRNYFYEKKKQKIAFQYFYEKILKFAFQ